MCDCALDRRTRKLSQHTVCDLTGATCRLLHVRYQASILHLFLIISASPLTAQKAPADFGKPDHEIRIGVLPGVMRYDKESFSVGIGSKVKLTLVNTDEMQHNLLICAQGDDVIPDVAAASMMLGADASSKHYVPDIKEVLFHTKAISLGQEDTIWFEAPKTPGAYPYICTLPGHVWTMVGVMHVGETKKIAKNVPIELLRYRLYKGAWKNLPNFDTLAPEREGALPDGLIDLAALKEKSQFGACFTGVLNVEEAGSHTFYLNSDDGSRLLVGGKMVVEYDGLHGPAKEQTGTIDLTAGRHPLRVEFFQGNGGKALRVAYQGPDKLRRDLNKKNSGAEARMTPIMVHHHPVVMRVHVEGAAARTIAVGLPGGMNYCFDADKCCVQFGWAGAYLDVGPDRVSRGGNPCKLLGKRFEVGNIGFPLRTSDGNKRPVKMLEYRTAGMPRFHFDWGGILGSCTIAAAKGKAGLVYNYEMPSMREALQFQVDDSAAEFSSSAGDFQDGLLDISAADAGKFSITVTIPNGGLK